MELTKKQREIYNIILQKSDNGKYVFDRYLLDFGKPISTSIIESLEKKGFIKRTKERLNAYERRRYEVVPKNNLIHQKTLRIL